MTIRSFLKHVAKLIFLYSGYIQGRNVLQRLRKKSLITVLAYHRVDDPQGDVNAVSPVNFERQMAYLRKHYRVITVAEALQLLKSGRNCERAVVITFDDGYRDNFLNAMPILKKHGLPACFFVSSGIVGTDRHFDHDLELAGRPLPVMSWEDVRQLAANGFEIGSHTVNHARLSRCSIKELRHELADSKAQLEQQLGSRVDFFSFPFGLRSDFSDEALTEIKRAGYSCNFSAFGGVNPPGSDCFAIKRQAVADSDSLLYYRAWIEGWEMRSRY